MRKITYAKAINETFREILKRDPKVFLMGEDLGKYGNIFRITEGLLEEFGPERIIETPISEAAFTGAGIGAALTGMRPVVEIMLCDFITLAMDQIINNAAKMHYMFGGKANIPLVIRTVIGAGNSAGAQHSQALHALFFHIPGLKLILPSTPYDVKGLLVSAIYDNNPILFIENRNLYYAEGEVPEELYSIPLGKADIKRKGKDVTVFATSSMVQKSLEVGAELEREGISLEVVDPRSLVPLDKETLFESLSKTGRLVIVDEGTERGGVAAEIAALVAQEAFDLLDAPIYRVCSQNVPIPFSPVLEQAMLPKPGDIKKAVQKVLA